MADELTQFGVPGVDTQGRITPFSPNPPWVPINNNGGGVPDLNANVQGLNSPAFYKDVFGNIHVRGSVIVAIGLLAAGQYTITTLPVTYQAQPTTIRRFPATAFPFSFNGAAPLGTPIPVMWEIVAVGNTTSVRLKTGVNLTGFTFIPFEIVWETT